MISIEKYIELIKAKNQGRLKQHLVELLPEGLNKPESELYLADLWLRSLHENSELIYDCEIHGSTKIKPSIQLNKQDDYTYTMGNGLRLVLKQPPFITDSAGEQILRSIESIQTETEMIMFEDLSEQELKNLTDQLTIEDIKNILQQTNKETIYLVYQDCCGEQKTIVGFDKIMEIL